MKRWLPFVLILFGFDQIGVAGSQGNQTSIEINQKQALVSDSISQKPINLVEYEGSKKDAFDIFTSTFENKFSGPDTKDYLSELQLKQVSYSANVQEDLPRNEKVVIKKDNRSEEFDFGNGLTFNVPFWVVGTFLLFVIYTIFISLRFLSIYFQDVSSKEQLEIISGDFDSYKRNTIEKERKLMRDLIDAKNRINDLSQ